MLEKLGVDPSPVYTGPPYALDDADTTEYPLQMIPGSRYRELTASNLRQSARLKRIHPEPIMDIHPQTAAGLGIEDGEWVLIERPEGTIRQRAHFNEGIRLDTVNPDGYWWEPGTQTGEPSLSGVWVSNANAITPSETKFSSFAGDQPLARRPLPRPEGGARAGDHRRLTCRRRAQSRRRPGSPSSGPRSADGARRCCASRPSCSPRTATRRPRRRTSRSDSGSRAAASTTTSTRRRSCSSSSSRTSTACCSRACRRSSTATPIRSRSSGG